MFKNPENPSQEILLLRRPDETSQRLSVVERLRCALKKDSIVSVPIFQGQDWPRLMHASSHLPLAQLPQHLLPGGQQYPAFVQARERLGKRRLHPLQPVGLSAVSSF